MSARYADVYEQRTGDGASRFDVVLEMVVQQRAVLLGMRQRGLKGNEPEVVAGVANWGGGPVE